jgi:c-di-GMP-binding flagellar brake protein YcgR
MVPHGLEQRRHLRVNVGPDCKAILQVGQESSLQVQIKDISLSGCRVMVPMQEVGPLEKGITLDRLQIQHPKLPTCLLRGEVRWVLGKVPNNEKGCALMGIEFHRLPANFSFALGLLVDELMG